MARGLKRLATGLRDFAPWSTLLKEVLVATAMGVTSTALAWIAFRLTPETFGLRWGTGGPDQVLHYLIFRSAGDVFPFLPNPALGFPEAQNLFFAPLFDPWSALWVAGAHLITSDSVVVLNAYLLLTFFSTAFTATIFFRLLRIRRILSMVFALAFAVLPLHFMQLALGHPFLANYWAVPLIGIQVLMIGGARTNPWEGWIAASTTGRMRAARRWIPIMGLALLVGLTQSYYFVFGVIICGGVLLFRALQTLVLRDKWRAMMWPAVTVAALVVVVGTQLALLSLNFGDRYEKYFAARTAGESELYGGKIAALLLPWPQTGIPGVGAISQKYFSLSSVVPTSEGPWSSVLVVISIFVVVSSIFIMVLGQRGSVATKPSLLDEPRLRVFSMAFLWTLFFYITSGLGVIFAVIVSPEIRAWSRISVVLSLLALAFVAIIVDKVTDSQRIWRWTAAGIVLVLVLVDQVGGAWRSVPLSPQSDVEIRELVTELESRLPAECGVVQLPLKSFPESGNIGEMGDYDHGLLYLYSTDLRWSYGAVRGTTAGDFWEGLRGAVTVAKTIESSGACAVAVNTLAYVDDDRGWESITDRLDVTDVITSPGGTFVVYLLQ